MHCLTVATAVEATVLPVPDPSVPDAAQGPTWT